MAILFPANGLSFLVRILHEQTGVSIVHFSIVGWPPLLFEIGFPWLGVSQVDTRAPPRMAEPDYTRVAVGKPGTGIQSGQKALPTPTLAKG